MKVALNQAITARQIPWVRWQLMIKPSLAGIAFVLALFYLHFALLVTLGSSSNALKQVMLSVYWIGPLLLVAGIQIVTFYYINGFKKFIEIENAPKIPLVSSTFFASGALLACCIGYLAVAIPLIGDSAFVDFLNNEQVGLMAIGIVLNILGIGYLVKFIRKNNLYLRNGNFVYFSIINSIVFFLIAYLISVTFLGLTIY